MYVRLCILCVSYIAPRNFSNAANQVGYDRRVVEPLPLRGIIIIREYEICRWAWHTGLQYKYLSACHPVR